MLIYLFLLLRCCPVWAKASSFLRFLDHTQRRNIVGSDEIVDSPLPDNTVTTNIRVPGGIRKHNQPQTYALGAPSIGFGV
jgi:hypothetical protein